MDKVAFYEEMILGEVFEKEAGFFPVDFIKTLARKRNVKKLVGEDVYGDGHVKLQSLPLKKVDKLNKKVFLSKEVKPLVEQAIGLRKELNQLYNNDVYFNKALRKKVYDDFSKSYKKEYESEYGVSKDPKVLREIKDNTDYYFDHGVFEDSEELQEASERFVEKSSKLKQYDRLMNDIGNKATRGFSEKRVPHNTRHYQVYYPIDNLYYKGDHSGQNYKNYGQWARNKANNFIAEESHRLS